MAQGGRSERERQQAAQRREAERQRREAERQIRDAARQAKEADKARTAAHQDQQQQLVDNKTAAVTAEIKALDTILVSVLDEPPLTFDQLTVKPTIPAFQPGTLTTPLPAPSWSDFAPVAPHGLGGWFGGTRRYQRDLAAARTRFEAATADHRRREAERIRALDAARAEHQRAVDAARAKAEAHNRQVETRRAGFAAGEFEAVEWFVDRVLRASRYPRSFPRSWQVAYRPENHDVVIEFELPTQQVVPQVREYRYVKARDVINPVPRPMTEIRKRYAHLVAAMSLRVLHEVFTATPGEVVEAVVFNGWAPTINPATGKAERAHLVAVQPERARFTDLVLSNVDPVHCLRKLGAIVSPNPYDLEAIEPFIAFDLKRFRLVDAEEELAELDSRQNLMKLSPTAFERLVKTLFEAMGAEAWRTIPSKDGGIDAVATSKNLFFGGVCLIQAKRWTNLVGLDAVHALTGVMADHNATTGVLVTTSWFGRASEEFAQRNRITLINGAELKHLLKQHLDLDVVPGTNPPRRLRASDNRQTGRPGPG